MPRRAVVIAEVNDEEVERFRAELMRHGTSHAGHARRVINNLREFMEKNRLRHFGESDDYILEHFLLSIGSQTQANTLATVAATIESFRIRPSELGRAMERVDHQEFLKCIRRRGAKEAALREKPTIALHVMLRLLEPQPEESQRTRHLRAFWYLLVVTGGRPANLHGATFEIVEDGVEIHWALRKGGRHGLRSKTLYEFRFAAPPSPYIRAILAEIKPGVPERGWDMPCADQIASTMCSFIKRSLAPGAVCFTSTAPRDRLAGILLGEVDAMRMTGAHCEWLMDHCVEQGRQSYASST